MAVSLRALGYDLLGPVDQTGRRAEFIDERAVMAFQAAEGFAISGRPLDADQLRMLHRQAARQIDLEAHRLAAVARDLAARSQPVDRPEETVRTIKGQIDNARFLGSGEFSFGGRFDGSWMDSNSSRGPQRPALGVLYMKEGCSVSLRTILLAEGTYYLSDLLRSSIGVVRRKEQILHAGALDGIRASNGEDPCQAVEATENRE
jgi:hypothetical protein